MTNKNSNVTAPILWLAIVISLFVVAMVSDILGAICYIQFARANGLGWFQPLPWAMNWKFFTSFPGNILTSLGVLPYLMIWAGFYFMGFDSELDDERFEQEDSGEVTT